MKNHLVYLAHMPQWDVCQPPMGISYIGGFLKNKGYNVQLSDFSIELYSQLKEDEKFIMSNGAYHINWIHEEQYRPEVYPKIASFIDECAETILSQNPTIVGFSVLTTNILPTIDLAKNLKARNPYIKIILGGPYVTRYEGAPWAIKQECIDFVVPDEGEEVSAELVNFILEDKVNYQDIKGLIFRDTDNNVIDTGPREMIEDINQIPYPLYEMFPLHKYSDPSIPILGSRGCIFACSFCSETVFWKRFRYRSADNIVTEFKHHLNHFKTNYFYIVDSLINGDMKELVKMCELIIAEGLDIKWGGKASIRTQMTKEVLELMVKAGCDNLQYGIESGSPKVIREMRKGFTAPIAKRVLRDSCDAGIKVGCFFLVGFPTETNEDYEETKSFIKDIEPYLDHLIPGFGMGILAGSEVHDNPDKFGIKWDENGQWFTEHVNSEIVKVRVDDFRKFCDSLTGVNIG